MLNFITQLLNGLTMGCIYALIAVGYTMVYGIIKLINFAHGEFFMFGAYVGYFTLVLAFGGSDDGRELGYGALLISALLAGLFTGILSVIVEWIVYRPLRKAGRIVALLAALGVSLFMQNVAQKTVQADVRTFPVTFPLERLPREKLDPSSIRAGIVSDRDIAAIYTLPLDGGTTTRNVILASRGNQITQADRERLDTILTNAAKEGRSVQVFGYYSISITNRDLIIMLTLAVISAGLYGLVQHTRFGRAMRAVSHDFDAAALMGVDVDRVIAGTFFCGAFVAGVGGTLGGGMYYGSITPLMGMMPGLYAFVAAVIGGIGSVPGAVLGGLLLGVAEAMINTYVSSMYKDAFTFGILILMLLVRPYGLLGKPASDKL